jgi:hypothetical protein
VSTKWCPPGSARAGGFFSIGGVTAVKVHGGTVEASIVAETALAFTILDAAGELSTIGTSAMSASQHY